MVLLLSDEIRNKFPDQSQLFDQIMMITGNVYRAVERRETLRFIIHDKAYFIKKHFGIGWKEIFKNLLQGRFPVLSAKNERNAITHLQNIGINTPHIMGYGKRRLNPAKIQSFIITSELTNTKTLNDLLIEWKETPPSFRLKEYLTTTLAELVSRMHQSGLNHRDCYLLHFRIDKSISTHLPQTKFPIYVIDLHRAHLRRKVPTRWIIKDLAGLYFSGKTPNYLTQRDFFRFMKAYTGKPLKQIFLDNLDFWQKVQYKGEKVYDKHQNVNQSI